MGNILQSATGILRLTQKGQPHSVWLALVLGFVSAYSRVGIKTLYLSSNFQYQGRGRIAGCASAEQ